VAQRVTTTLTQSRQRPDPDAGRREPEAGLVVADVQVLDANARVV